MLGVIVCGGQSTRMGDDKGLLVSDNKTWVQTAVEKITALNLPFVLSINEKQVEKYQSVFRREELILDADALEIAGPLLGILSVHLRFPEQDILALACDMPNMHSLVLKELLQRYRADRQFEAVTFLNNNHVEPLCAIYTARGLGKILWLYESKNLQRNSLRYVLETLHTNFITTEESWSPYFKNFNSPEDLRPTPWAP